MIVTVQELIRIWQNVSVGCALVRNVILISKIVGFQR